MQDFLIALREAFAGALAGEDSVAVLDGPPDPMPTETLAVIIGVAWSDRQPPITTTETDVGADSLDVAATVSCALSRREPTGTDLAEVRGRALANIEALRTAVQFDQTVRGTAGIARIGGTTRIWQGQSPSGTWCDVAFDVSAIFYL